jgi:hypothetical protein
MKIYETDQELLALRNEVQDATKEIYGLAENEARIRKDFRRCINETDGCDNTG